MVYDYLVVGSGLYGAIFAHETKARSKSVLVADKRPNVGGNIYTEKVGASTSMSTPNLLTHILAILLEFLSAVQCGLRMKPWISRISRVMLL